MNNKTLDDLLAGMGAQEYIAHPKWDDLERVGNALHNCRSAFEAFTLTVQNAAIEAARLNQAVDSLTIQGWTKWLRNHERYTRRYQRVGERMKKRKGKP